MWTISSDVATCSPAPFTKSTFGKPGGFGMVSTFVTALLGGVLLACIVIRHRFAAYRIRLVRRHQSMVE